MKKINVMKVNFNEESNKLEVINIKEGLEVNAEFTVGSFATQGKNSYYVFECLI